MNNLSKYICVDEEYFGDRRTFNFVQNDKFPVYKSLFYRGTPIIYLRLDVFHWIVQNIGWGFDKWESCFTDDGSPKIRFKNEEDAVAFKLRWE